ncbi:MAG: ribosome recycling factor [Candidatus Omnitrophica bacterium]|nr:ribosome recycling factor [Candidatus Omnitrophota bacterium]
MQTLTSTKSVVDETQRRMQKTLDAVKSEFHNLRTGRASIALVETIQVECYGSTTPLKSVASILTPDAKTIAIQPWDPSVCAAVEKAILKSGLGLTPANDGKVIRIKVPALTEERRHELDKLIRKISEDGRISIRNVRHEANEAVKRLEKAKTISEDESRTTQKKVQECTDRFIKLVDETLSKKESEIKEV